jgi:2-keto-4-pentenoate hydratase
MLTAGETPVRPDTAYEMQARVRRQLHPEPDIAGFKLGYTSEVMRAAMGIEQPNHGALFDSMVLTSPALVRELIQPKVEPDSPCASMATVRWSNTSRASKWSTRCGTLRVHLAHNTADRSSAAYAVLGSRLDARLRLVVSFDQCGHSHTRS